MAAGHAGNPAVAGLEGPGATPTFRSWLMGGFESSCHRRSDGHQLDMAAMTRHDAMAEQDYRMLAECGIHTARDALRWHLIEREPGRPDWDSALPMLRAARATGTQVIWDLCHYGLPHDLDIWSGAFVTRFATFAAAAAQVVRAFTDGPSFFCPINEISYWSWAGGAHGLMYPFGDDQGAALKGQLLRAAIAATRAIRVVDPAARFVQAEPLIHVVPRSAEMEEIAAADAHRRAQYEAFDALAEADCLDIVGVNFYFNNQWLRDGPTIPLGDPAFRPLRDLLAEVAARYRRPLLIAETGAEGINGPGWLRYVAGEARAARRAGVPVTGLCLYPVMDYPGWENARHCRCGLLRSDPAWESRTVDPELQAQLREEQVLETLCA